VIEQNKLRWGHMTQVRAILTPGIKFMYILRHIPDESAKCNYCCYKGFQENQCNVYKSATSPANLNWVCTISRGVSPVQNLSTFQLYN